jgi:hypothetical protein
MKPGVRSIVVTVTAGLLVLALTERVGAIGPSLLMFYGGSLPAPVFVTGADANLFGDLLTPSTVASKDTEGRSYLKVAVFWGTQANPTGHGIPIAQLKPDMAWQHGKYYPAAGAKPAVLIVTTLDKKGARIPPSFESDSLFPWGGAVSKAAAVAVQKATAISKPSR